MWQLAERYADELTAQFRTLNYFVMHAGEIGAAHETYLKGIISRFLPAKFSLGTGFIANPDWVSTQQDIIIYQQPDLPLLFQVGECVVVDSEAVIGTIEVKTRLDNKNDFLDAYQKLSKLGQDFNNSYKRCFTALFIWDGLSLKTMLSTISEYVAKYPPEYWDNLPNVIYVRSKYLLLLNDEQDKNNSHSGYFIYPKSRI